MTKFERLSAVATALSAAIVLAAPAPSAAEPLAKPGQTVELDGNRITFAGVERLSNWDRKKHECPGAFRVYWIVESRPGDKYPPGLGELKLTLDGEQYNAVTYATSSKPLAPDVTIHDLRKFVKEHPGALKYLGPKPRADAPVVVFEAFLYGAAVNTWKAGTAELEVGLFDAGVSQPPKKVRWEWVRFALPAPEEQGG